MVNEPELGLFLDLGLGKTIISLIAIKRLISTGKVKRVLIVAPITVMHNVWEQEADKWEYTQGMTFTKLHGPEKKGRLLHPSQVHIVNYEGIQWLCDTLRRTFKYFPYDMVIFDESSKLKSHKTKRFKTLKGLIKQFKRRYLLTATPAPNALTDLWSQFFIMDGGETFGTAYFRFLNRYFYEAYKYKWVVKDFAEAELQEKVAPKTMRLKAEDYLKMPPITYNHIELEMPVGMQKKYNKFEEEYFIELEEAEAGIEVFNAAALSMKLRQFIQGGMYNAEGKWTEIHRIKLNALKELIDTSAGQPILCPIQFKGELAMLTKEFGSSVPVIAGGTSQEQTSLYIKKWNDGQIPLMFCHPASLSHGINLQAGGHILLWYGLTWSLEQYLQLNGRLYRQGQQNAVFIHHLIMKNTVDEAVVLAINSKTKTQESLFKYIKDYWRKKR